jgi:hypothetical protein
MLHQQVFTSVTRTQYLLHCQGPAGPRTLEPLKMNKLHYDTASHPRRPKSSTKLEWKPKILQASPPPQKGEGGGGHICLVIFSNITIASNGMMVKKNFLKNPYTVNDILYQYSLTQPSFWQSPVILFPSKTSSQHCGSLSTVKAPPRHEAQRTRSFPSFMSLQGHAQYT